MFVFWLIQFVVIILGKYNSNVFEHCLWNIANLASISWLPQLPITQATHLDFTPDPNHLLSRYTQMLYVIFNEGDFLKWFLWWKLEISYIKLFVVLRSDHLIFVKVLFFIGIKRLSDWYTYGPTFVCNIYRFAITNFIHFSSFI